MKVALLLLGLAFVPSLASAVVPRVIGVQGALRNQAGLAAPDGSYGLTFRLFPAKAGGAPVYEEKHGAVDAVSVTDGVFAADLGGITPLPLAALAAAPELWVEVQVETEAPLPRARVTSVAYALEAVHAESASALDGPAEDLKCTACVELDELTADVVTETELSAALADLAATVYTRQAIDAKLAAISADVLNVYTREEVDAKLAAVSAELQKYLPLAGGTVTGDLEVRGTLDAALKPASLRFGANLGYAELVAARAQNAATPPVACTAQHEGLLYWDTAKKALCICDSADWACGLKPTLGTPQNPAPSCAALAGSSTGMYTIDPDGAGPIVAAETHCEMSTGGGGWTLVAAWDASVSAGPWGSTTSAIPSLTTKFQLPFASWFPAPQRVLLRYGPTGDTLERAVTGTSWQSSGHGLRIAAGSDYLTFANTLSSRRGICIHSGVYDSGFNCDGDEGQINGVGLYEDNATNEVCGCSSPPYWKQNTTCTPTYCSATGLVAIYLK